MVAIFLVTILCVGMSSSVVQAKNGETDLKTLEYLEHVENDVYFDTTIADPNFDPLSSLDAEVLEALHDAPPNTRIDYDPVTSTVTIPDQDATSEIITETSPYVPDSSGPQKAVVSGNGAGDQRTQITNVGVYPYAATVYITMDYGNGVTGRGSGAFVGPNIILTAGHVVCNDQYGWAKSITIKPGGVLSSVSAMNAASWASVTGWVQNHDENYDYGVIVLNNSPGVGYFGMTTVSNNDLGGSSIYCYGYPCDKQFGTLWYSPGHVYAYTPSLIYHTADTISCESGGPIVRQSDYKHIIAIHTGPKNSVCNRSVRITSDIINYVRGF